MSEPMPRSVDMPEAAKARIVEIGDESDGQRIDNYLIKMLKGVPRTRIYKALRKGEVRVNGSRKKALYNLVIGDKVRVPPIRYAMAKGDLNIPPRLLDHVPILYEDEHLLVVNKPSGLAVHGGTGVRYGLIEAFRELRPELRYLELVHRLDRETSGCLMLAKSRQALLKLHEKLGNDRSIGKYYLALVKGEWGKKPRTIRLTLRKQVSNDGQTRMVVDRDGQIAISVIRPHRHFENSTLLSIELKTGRMHQARVHCASSHFPIAGDRVYGDDAFNKQMKKLGLGRLFLHACRIEMAHPMTEMTLNIEAPLPGQMSNFLKAL
ncbi:MAG: RluA family pseudouridine synthase [Gammaproteobacteria bacterium]|nr:RluA family pseudouridine synthase [Gammaproteobacteria bacterium]